MGHGSIPLHGIRCGLTGGKGAIATDLQISKTDRNQTADTVRSFYEPSKSGDVHLQNYL